MQTRSTAIFLAIATLATVFGLLWYEGWFNSFNYQKPTPILVTQVPTVVPVATSSSEIINVSLPQPYATSSGSLLVSGKARGQWYFEGSFPIQVRDSDNNLIASAIAQAQGEWMTEEFVPFTATLSFASTTYRGPADVVLLKDNPSGLPENEDSVTIPITIQ
jgi:Immunoglobulin-like domain of bacterial spore germination